MYELTEWGQELEPTLRALGRWAATSPYFPETGHFSPTSLAMNLETMFLPGKAAGLDLTDRPALGDESFRLRIANRALELERGEAGDADAVIDDRPDDADRRALRRRRARRGRGRRRPSHRGRPGRRRQAPSLFELPEPVELEPAAA